MTYEKSNIGQDMEILFFTCENKNETMWFQHVAKI
jgi:hypothetical protein